MIAGFADYFVFAIFIFQKSLEPAGLNRAADHVDCLSAVVHEQLLFSLRKMLERHIFQEYIDLLSMRAHFNWTFDLGAEVEVD